ncbi:MAG: DMT family transporter [Planctomycetes bacterium]|nr:DMT family transporter [Planctomycetota bacterium]
MAYLYVLGAVLCWASFPAAAAVGLATLAPAQTLGLTFTVSTTVLWLIHRFSTKGSTSLRPVSKRTLAWAVWGFLGFHAAYFFAMNMANHIGAQVETVLIVDLWPLGIVLFAWPMLKQPFRWPIGLAALLGLAGTVAVVWQGHALSVAAAAFPAYGLGLVCAVSWSSYSVSIRKHGGGPGDLLAGTGITALAGLLLWGLMGPHAWPPLNGLLSALFIGLFPCGLAFALWDRGVRTGDMQRIGLLTFLTPPLALLALSFVTGSAVTAWSWSGLGLILLASAVGRMGASTASKAA